MGNKKHSAAEARKERKRTIAYAILKNSNISERKMALVANIIRGKKASDALNILTHTNRASSESLRKLLLSAIANWEAKFQDSSIERQELIIDELRVDKGKMLKRIQPAPQGRAHRIMKRSCHVYLSVS